MNRVARIRSSLLLIMSGLASFAHATNWMPVTGARAAGLAGIFVAQADDSSAAWYNPAATRLARGLELDASVEWGVAGKADTSPVRSASMYAELRQWGLGAIYLSPFHYLTNVSAVANPLSGATYGNIDAVYRQASLTGAHNLGHDTAIGAALDLVWADVTCETHKPCVENGPLGPGASLSLAHRLSEKGGQEIVAGLLWRSAARLEYATTPSYGLGSVLTDYLPGRPETLSIGVRVSHMFYRSALNVNTAFDHIRWGDAAPRYENTVADTSRLGVGSELLMALNDVTLSLRAGIARIFPSNGTNDLVFATGFGAVLERCHAVDAAFVADKSSNTVALSYSYQH